jgi:hypothetical protein
VTHAFTKRNHYNPCFWTALWNRAYFRSIREGAAVAGIARDHVVHTLNLRGDAVFPTTVGNVHYEKDLGVAPITPDSMKSFCRRWYPSEYEGLAEYVDRNPETLYLDFEDTLEGLERIGVYRSLMRAARIGGISSVCHNGFLTCALVVHVMRSHELMTSMIESSSVRGLQKWEYFWLLKNAWANRLMLARAATPLAMGQWTLYATVEDQFPLPDSPIMIKRDTLMAVLSPRLLLEINLTVSKPEAWWVVRDGISPSKYREFRRRAIGNAFKDIIFHDAALLEKWRALPEYRQRKAALTDPETRERLVREAASRAIWGLNGFGRVPPNFETWIGKYLRGDSPEEEGRVGT